MKYLKYFQEESEYTGYKSSTSYVVPNVSYVVSTNLTFFDSGESSTTNIILYEDGYYPEVGQKLQELANKYKTRLGLSNLGMDEIRIYCDEGHWECHPISDYPTHCDVDVEDRNFLMLLQLPGFPTFFEVLLYNNSVCITCCMEDDFSSLDSIELYYDGTVIPPPVIS